MITKRARSLSLDRANEQLLTPRREDNHDNKKTLLAHSIDILAPRSPFALGVCFSRIGTRCTSSRSLEAGKGETLLDTSGDRSQEAAPSPVPGAPVMPSLPWSASSAPAELLLGANRPGRDGPAGQAPQRDHLSRRTQLSPASSWVQLCLPPKMPAASSSSPASPL